MFDSLHPAVIRLRDDPRPRDTHAMWPDLDAASFAPLEIRQHGLRMEAFHPGRLTAWVRQSSVGWLAVVETTVHSADGASVSLTLLVPGRAVRRGGELIRFEQLLSTQDGTFSLEASLLEANHKQNYYLLRP